MERNFFTLSFLLLVSTIYSQSSTIILRYRTDSRINEIKGYTLILKSQGGALNKLCTKDSVVTLPEIRGDSLYDVTLLIAKQRHTFKKIAGKKMNGTWDLNIDRKPFEEENLIASDRSKKIKLIRVLTFINKEGDYTDLTTIIYKE